MKKLFLLVSTLAVVSPGVILPSVQAGVSSSLTLCSDCGTSPCTCATGCGCSEKGHNYFFHAPIGVMGDHIHKKGGLMASYRYMIMDMQQNYDGDSRISDAAARAGYMMVAQDMQMQMHMLGVMYAPTDKLTLMLMSNYKDMSMTMANPAGVQSVMKSSGWGDVTLSAYYSLYKKRTSSAHFGLGLSIPTGSIDEKMANGMRMGYPMQLGSGTWDLKPSITWLGTSGGWSYGSQANAVIRLGENDHGYSLGDRVSLTGWVSHHLSDWSSVSLRLTGSAWGNVDGRDDQMPVIPMGPLAGNPMAAVVDPSARGGKRIDLALGFNLWSTEHGTRFAVEGGVPLYQNLDGPQLGIDWFMTLGLQVAW